MGNQLPRLRVHAAENDAESSGLMNSLKSRLPIFLSGGSSSETDTQNVHTPSPDAPLLNESIRPLSDETLAKDSGDFLSDSTSASGSTKSNERDISAADKTPLSELADDPRRIYSTLPSFPGSWNDLHKAKELFPMPFDGLRVTLNKGLSNHFQVSHNFTLGTMQPSSYRFGATYAGTKQLSQTETFPILTGEMDPSGNLTAQCLYAFSRNTRSRLVAQHQGGKFVAIELGTDYRGPLCTLSATAANPDLLAQTGIYIGQCLFPVRPNLAVGLEAVLQRGMNPHIGQIAAQASGSLAAKYNGENWSAAAQISPLELGAHLSYYHKLNENQAVGVELEGKVASGECATTLGYSFDIPGAECVVKASIDSRLTIATTIEKKLTPLPMTLALCCQGNQKKAQYIVGIGLSTG